jgi:uncharacterized membrane protein YhhN
MFNIWLLLAGGLAITHWVCRWYEWKWIGTITKPSVMIAIIVWSWGSNGWQGGMKWFGFGLLFSLAGDIFLMLKVRWFLWGTAAFLGAHLCYFLGFNAPNFILYPSRFLAWLPFFGLDLFFIIYITRIGSAKSERSTLLPLIGSVYFTMISLMCASAWSTLLRPDWALKAAVLGASGALLFLISDSILIFNRFLRQVAHAHFWVMISYYLAQITITAGAFLQFQ